MDGGGVEGDVVGGGLGRSTGLGYRGLELGNGVDDLAPERRFGGVEFAGGTVGLEVPLGTLVMLVDVLGVRHWEGDGAEVGIGGGMFDQRPAVDVACNHDCSFLCERGRKKQKRGDQGKGSGPRAGLDRRLKTEDRRPKYWRLETGDWRPGLKTED